MSFTLKNSSYRRNPLSSAFRLNLDFGFRRNDAQENPLFFGTASLPRGEQNVYISELWAKEGVFPCVPCQSFSSCSRFSRYHPALPTMPAAAKAAAAKAAPAGAALTGRAYRGLRLLRFADRRPARRASRRMPRASASASRPSLRPGPRLRRSSLANCPADLAGKANERRPYLIVTAPVA